MLKAPLLSALAALAAVALALGLNPSPEAHRDAIRQAVAESSPVAGMLGLGAITAFTSTYHPLGVASYTTFDGRVVSVGAFGGVFVLQRSEDR